MKNLTLHKLDPSDQLVFPDQANDLGFTTPALAILTDFRYHKPLILEADTPLIDAERLMPRAHVHLKLIVDKSNALLGLLSAEQLFGEAVLKLTTQGTNRNDITVSQLMTPRSKLSCLSFNELHGATIGDVVHCLQHDGVHHCLVVDQWAQQIRGLISARDIAERVHIDIPISEKAASFLDIFNALHPA